MLAICAPQAQGQARRSSSAVKKERQEAGRRISQTQEQIKENARLTRSRLNSLNSLQADIQEKNTLIAKLKARISAIEADMRNASDSIAKIGADVETLRKSAAESLRQSRSMRQSMTATAMIFSSKNFSDAMRRADYLKQLDKSRSAKAKSLREHIDLLEQKKARLEALRQKQAQTLAALSKEQEALAAQQADMEIMLTELKKNGKALEKELADRKAKAAQLDRELDRIIAEEQRLAAIEEQKRIEAERLKKQEEERRLALEAERKAAEEAQARREQEEKDARDAKAKDKADKAAKKKAEKEAKKRKEEIRKQEEARQKELRRQKEKQKQGGDMAAATPAPPATPAPAPAASASHKPMTAAQLTQAFAKNKGAMLFPVEGSHRVVSQFGRSAHENLSKVQVENSGIDIETQKRASARAVFQGTVTSIFYLDGYHNIVMLRHGEYLTVYANIVDLAVKKGDNVMAGEAIGRVWADPDDDDRSILHFEVRKERQKLNPLEWVR